MLAAAAAAFVASRTPALEFKGYFRDSVGFNLVGGGQACFQLPGSDFKARLGNECERYLEAGLSQTGKLGKVEWRVEFMAASYQPTTSGAAPNYLFLQQMWGGLKFDELRGLSLWAGRRFYRRHDVHSIDWFYWNPAQGNAAAGVEDVDLGIGKVAFALIRIDATAPGDTTKDLVRGTYAISDLRLYDARSNLNGTVEIGLDVAIAQDQHHALGVNRAAVSPLFTIQHDQKKLLGGSNTFAFQYGVGAFAHESGDGPGQLLGGGTTADSQWRVIEHLVANPVPQVSGAVVLVYQNKSGPGHGGDGAHIFSAECRPAYQFGDYFKVAIDAFFQAIAPKDRSRVGGTPRLLKLTLAPTFVLGRGYFARPEFRFFLTYASWNDAAARAGPIGNGAFPAGWRSGLSAGVSVEWWF